MAIKVEKQDEQIPGNGWTRYQQLVLNELQRHEDKLNTLEREIINLRMANTRLEMEIKGNTDTLSKVLAELNKIESKFTSKVEALDDEREKLSTDLGSLKWKFAAASTVVATIFTAVIQGVIKFFLHS